MLFMFLAIHSDGGFGNLWWLSEGILKKKVVGVSQQASRAIYDQQEVWLKQTHFRKSLQQWKAMDIAEQGPDASQMAPWAAEP